MRNFADQCIYMARSILANNLSAVNEDGSITPFEDENSRKDEAGHAALAIGEYFRASSETKLDGFDLVDLCSRAITNQVFEEEQQENGLAYCAMGLLSFGLAKDRNLVWERLLEETRKTLDKNLLSRTDYDNHFQAFNIAKAVTRFSMGLSKKDETGKLIDLFIERLQANSSTQYFDDEPSSSPDKLGGSFNLQGVMSFVFIRQALQLHANIHLRERKTPTLRTYAEKYLKLISDIVRQDGMGWTFGSRTGAYGQMHCISLIMQAMRDGWISQDKMPVFMDILRRLFQFFFMTYIDQEQGRLVIRDFERTTDSSHTTRMANFDAARYLCQWARLAKSIGGQMLAPVALSRSIGRFAQFDKSSKKEQGVFIYQDSSSGVHLQLPLIAPDSKDSSDALAFPQMPGIFDAPANKYLPVMIPELKIGGKLFIPSFYGKKCTTSLGLRKSFCFKYEQDELITNEAEIVKSIGSWKVAWTFAGSKISSEFILSVKNQVQLDSMRLCIPVSMPHTQYRLATSYTLGEECHRASVVKDDFQAVWADPEIVAENMDYRTRYGNIVYIQTLIRDHSLVLRPGVQYKLCVNYEPHITFADA